MNNNVNDNPSKNKEAPNIDPSKQDAIGSEVPLGEPVSTPRKRKSLFGKNKSKATAKVKQPNGKQAKSAKKDKKSTNSATALKVILVVLLFSVIALAAVWFLMKPEIQQNDTPVVIDTSSSVVKPQEQQPIPAGQPLDNQLNQPTTANPEMKPTVDGQQPVVANDKTDAKVATVDQANTPLPTANTAVNGANKPATVAEISKPTTTTPSAVDVIDPNKIINAEVPQDESLIKEELDKLADEEQRLEKQEKLLDKRLKMMDELTAKKQEQIELLEKQIAQLEESGK